MAKMLIPRAEFTLVTYGDAVFAIGGERPEATNQVDRWTLSQGWVNMASYPMINIARHCSAADEGYDTIYVMGGIIRYPGPSAISQVNKYTVSTDTWSSFPGLPGSKYESGCGIINKRTDGHRWLVHIGSWWSDSIYYYNLSTRTGWFNHGTIQVGWHRLFWISLTPYEAYVAGGNSGLGPERERYYTYISISNTAL
jgi:hypothetical protein